MAGRPRFWHRVRFKLLLVSLTLLGIPWAGYRFIQETELFLRDAQDQALQTTANSVANIMHAQPGVFSEVAKPGTALTFRNLFLHHLNEAPQLDGYRDEWENYEHNFIVLESVDETLEARIFLGEHDRYLYLLLGVKDPQPAFGNTGDAVDIAFTDPDGILQRYRLQPQAPGWVVARRHRLQTDPDDPDQVHKVVEYEPAIRGEWQTNHGGYTLELRLPRDRVGDRLSLRIFDSSSEQVLASGRMFPADAVGRIVQPADEIDEVLASVTPPSTRVWVTDNQGLVLARSGELDEDAPLSTDAAQMPWFIQRLILAVLPHDADAIADLPDDRSNLYVQPVVNALRGRPSSLRRQPKHGHAVVVSAAVPIRRSDGILGAVLVEQTTNAILSIQNLALQRLFGVTLLLFAVTSLGLLAFASLLASRITRLRNKVESAVSHDGRIIGALQPDRAKDEVGDLGRSFASVLKRLHEYNHYLEAMASRLAHELRTPLAVVRSSLDNAEQATDSERAPYLQRARDGAQRLEQILIRLREATGLEQALHNAEPVDFDIADLLRHQVEAYRGMHPAITWQLNQIEEHVDLRGVPDLISQALDKLVTNAVDFHDHATPVVIDLTADGHTINVSVSNNGPALPDGGAIFQSMYSGRSGRQDEPHLGLGLYLVRLICEFHGGDATAENIDNGVRVTMHLRRDAFPG